MDTIQVILRHGIAAPVAITLTAGEALALTEQSVEEGIEFLVRKAGLTDRAAAALRETLADPHAVVELRQGSLCRIVRRRSPLAGEAAVATPPAELAQPAPIEIGISRGQAGGTGR